jgi:hypothetical protein
MFPANSLRVINRKNKSEDISFDEINNRIKTLANFINEDYSPNQLIVNTAQITLETISKLFDGISTRQLDTESAKVCASLESIHYNYGILGGRILASDHQKHLKLLNLYTFSARMNHIDCLMPEFFNPLYIQFVNKHADELNSMIDSNRDYILNELNQVVLNKKQFPSVELLLKIYNYFYKNK